MKKAFYIIMLVANLLVIFCMLAGVATSWISPERAVLPTFFGLFFPYLFILNCGFIVFWLFRLKWQVVIPIVALILVSGELHSSFSFLKSQSPNPYNAVELKVLTYNVALFNFYEKKNKGLEYVANSGADIICMQECGFYKRSKDYLTEESVNEKLKDYPYRCTTIGANYRNRTSGTLLLSKHPIMDCQMFAYDEEQVARAMYADISVKGRILRVFNIYMESNKLTKRDKKATFDMLENLEPKALDSVTDTLSQRIGSAAKLREKQAKILAEHIAQSPYPVLVCGDFNDTPVSYTYKTVRGETLQDAFVGSGAGMGITYHESLLRVRIDYILYSKGLSASDFHIDHVKHSDHYPVQCSIWLHR